MNARDIFVRVKGDHTEDRPQSSDPASGDTPTSRAGQRNQSHGALASSWLVRCYPWMEVAFLCDPNAPSSWHMAWAESVVDSLALAYGQVWLNVSGEDAQTDRHVTSAREGVVRLLSWLRSLPESAEGLSLLKQWASWVRRVAVQDEAMGFDRPPHVPALNSVLKGMLSLNGYTCDEQARILFQITRFARAGPGPFPSQVAEATAQHTRDLKTTVASNKSDRVSIRRFASRWAHGKTWAGFSFPTSSGAAFGFPRVQEGLRGALRTSTQEFKSQELTTSLIGLLQEIFYGTPFAIVSQQVGGRVLDQERPDPVTAWVPQFTCGSHLFPYSEDYALLQPPVGPQEFDFLREHLLTHAAACVEVYRHMENEELPLAGRAIIQERGGKVRTVTPLEACTAYVAQVLNRQLLHLLNQDPRLRTDTECPLADSVDRLWRSEGEIIRSADLARASDLVPFWVSQALGDGISSQSPTWSPFWVKALRYCAGPVHIQDGDEVFTTESAILMGCGVTWPLLSLYNLWLWDGAWREAAMAERVGNSPPELASRALRKRVRLVGDDVGGPGPPVVSSFYTKRLKRTGGEPSSGKDFRSRRYGVLVEKLYAYDEDGQPRILPTVSVRKMQPASRVQGSGNREVPAWAMGPQLVVVWEELGKPEWFLKYVRVRYSSALAQLRRHEIEPYLPRTLGGGGFPATEATIRTCVGSLRPQWARALRCAMSFPKLGTLHLSRVAGIWTPGTSASLTSRERDWWLQVMAHNIVETDRAEDDDGVENPLASDALQQLLCAVGAAQDRLCPRPLASDAVSSVRELASGLGEIRESLNGLVPYPRLTDSVNDLGTGILRYCRKVESQRYLWSTLPYLCSIGAPRPWVGVPVVVDE
jgi:hypothetical protein